MLDNKWVDAMNELNSVLEAAKDAGITKAEAIQEVENIYGKE